MLHRIICNCSRLTLCSKSCVVPLATATADFGMLEDLLSKNEARCVLAVLPFVY